MVSVHVSVFACAAYANMFGVCDGTLFSGDGFGQEELTAADPVGDTGRPGKTASKRNILLIGGDSSLALPIIPPPETAAPVQPRRYSAVALAECQILQITASEYRSIFRICPCALMPQTTGAVIALREPPEARTDLQLTWIRAMMHQQKILSQLPPESIERLATTLTLRTHSKGEHSTFVLLPVLCARLVCASIAAWCRVVGFPDSPLPPSLPQHYDVLVQAATQTGIHCILLSSAFSGSGCGYNVPAVNHSAECISLSVAHGRHIITLTSTLLLVMT